MLMPSQLSVKPQITPLTVPDYDFSGQFRFDDTLTMATTSGTQQTFGSDGKPKDSTSDQD